MVYLGDPMAIQSSTLAWQIPWTEEPGRLQSMGSLGVRHDWATSLSCIGEGNGNPLQCSCLENPRDGGPWWAAVYGVAQNRTRLKRLSSNRGAGPYEKFQRIWLKTLWLSWTFQHTKLLKGGKIGLRKTKDENFFGGACTGGLLHVGNILRGL